MTNNYKPSLQEWRLEQRPVTSRLSAAVTQFSDLPHRLPTSGPLLVDPLPVCGAAGRKWARRRHRRPTTANTNTTTTIQAVVAWRRPAATTSLPVDYFRFR